MMRVFGGKALGRFPPLPTGLNMRSLVADDRASDRVRLTPQLSRDSSALTRFTGRTSMATSFPDGS
jgi:hypothetical protein